MVNLLTGSVVHVGRSEDSLWELVPRGSYHLITSLVASAFTWLSQSHWPQNNCCHLLTL